MSRTRRKHRDLALNSEKEYIAENFFNYSIKDAHHGYSWGYFDVMGKVWDEETQRYVEKPLTETTYRQKYATKDENGKWVFHKEPISVPDTRIIREFRFFKLSPEEIEENVREAREYAEQETERNRKLYRALSRDGSTRYHGYNKYEEDRESVRQSNRRNATRVLKDEVDIEDLYWKDRKDLSGWWTYW